MEKNYSIINQAWIKLKQEEGGDLSTYFALSKGTAPLIIKLGEYLSYSKTCGNSLDYGYDRICNSEPLVSLTNYYKSMSGGYISRDNLLFGQYILKDGAHIYFRTWSTNYTLCWVDVNGAKKKPNILGKDLFGMLITKDKILPLGAIGTGVDIEQGCNKSAYFTSPYGGSAGDFTGVGCAAKYLYE